ncbi:hypothetical protein T265_07532 [Opisthorchis viverrini]|uniref:Reverse transcriptase/retrotransposon-derived protein RNase H-like domain-containing protein n=1 Tax=Opisthorchis viverrini TaxID=6198 RepID=A0A075ABA0_OPIVI|nr:hypothetical protein T265_07532 [Opisthorchis viverrini]KER24909.1 hypothetical protein T265_07532 [Opisthorchis viverrini]
MMFHSMVVERLRVSCQARRKDQQPADQLPAILSHLKGGTCWSISLPAFTKLLKTLRQPTTGFALLGAHQFVRSSVTLIGRESGHGDVSPLPEKLAKFEDCTVPNSKRSLSQFLGRAAYYSRFVKEFNTIAAPLCDLLGKNRKFEWTGEAHEAFESVKARMSEQQLTLKMPRVGEMFIVATDSSDRCIGAVLKQRNGVIEYASRVLTNAGQKY